MIDYNSFGVVGGDRRQIALAESIASDGYTVYAFGFDTINFQKGVIKAELDEIAAKCENIILPLPVTADGKYLNTHYSEKKTPLDDTFGACSCASCPSSRPPSCTACCATASSPT